MSDDLQLHGQSPTEDEPDITMTDAGEAEPGEDPDFDESGEGVTDQPRDQRN
ncbi:hypothetical protein [Stutzerimonas azotifigens]|uniref:MatE family transporter n=1 Tax=Stutzerimonas azotifigens TaxID=291995 RepID=A0ABR5Z219_9GAMM|nr:hypothetical protein [Stutzerimonas azotifigens]MBA1274192.1 hypothetical protein [Stutzerimonas azotifigens]